MVILLAACKCYYGFLLRSILQLVPYLDLLTDNFLTANNSKEVYPILEEYRHRIQVLASGSFCSDLQKGVGYNRWEELNSAKFTPDDFFNVSIAFLDSFTQ